MLTAKAPTIDEALRRVDEISTLPAVALEVMRIASDSGASAKDLKRAVENDPALSSRVLRLVNSASAGVKTRVNNLQQAIGLLGFNAVRNLAMTASVSELFRQEESIGTYRRSELWRHMVSVGICARMIARRRGMSNFEDAYLAGLLHDIGLILMDQVMHDTFCEIITTVPDGAPLTAFEMEQFSYTHAHFGARVAESWKFPPMVRAAIRHHHDSEKYTGDGADTVQCIEAGNTLCCLKGITSIGKRCVESRPAVFRKLEFTRDDILVLGADLDKEIAQNEGLFEL